MFPDLGNAEHALRLVEKFNSDSGFYEPDLNKKPLKLQDNPWRMPPEAVVERGLEDTKTFLQDVQKAKKVTSLNLLKVVLVGSESVGKTRWEILARLSDYLELKSRTASTIISIEHPLLSRERRGGMFFKFASRTSGL